MAIPVLDQQTILHAVAAWPPHDQVALAQMILRQARGDAASPPVAPQRPGWREMVGLAATDHSPPSDEDVARWRDEHRVAKYA